MIPKFNIGNLAIHKGEIVKVVAINEFHQYHVEGDAGFREKWINDLQPIPLTKEWLSTWQGIEVDENAMLVWYRDGKKEVFIFAEIHRTTHAFYLPKNHFWIKRKLEFVHQAQNYFFEATGQELTIKQ